MVDRYFIKCNRVLSYMAAKIANESEQYNVSSNRLAVDSFYM
ncbi:hypothetical protein JCM19240_4917 [Vibrio maritimus]|uniref:Uncharacterized protein n=1 Tax=Vibrio maritimus TaxID=990268 RepID=A0A090TYS5_9VIBR|nr:hypothetical protein JCM19240_4917 [Vibrio maritimus]